MELSSVHEATQRAVQEALLRGATLDLATVASVSSKYARLLLADGTTIHGNTSISASPVRVGDVVRIARQGALTVVLGPLSIPNSVVVSTSNGSGLSVTSTTLAAIPGGPVIVSFVAPRSGQVLVHIRARLIPTATARALASSRIKDGLNNVIASDSFFAIEAPAGLSGAVAMGATHHYTGLTPGTSYQAEMVAQTSVAGQTITVSQSRVIVQPVL